MRNAFRLPRVAYTDKANLTLIQVGGGDDTTMFADKY